MAYEVVGVLGRGASAVVELAVDPAGVPVARKRIALHGSGSEILAARRRLRREAEILGRLDHPNIVPVLWVEDDGTEVVLVMPAMAGSLADRIRTGGPLPAADAVTLGRHLLGALAASHRAGIVHRDIKPSNILFSAEGTPALADFGIASHADLTAGLTEDGTAVGTPTWIAPEQARGEPVGPAADIFALGATLRYALTGQRPWGEGPPGAVLARAAAGRVDGVHYGVPGPLARPIRAMLDPDPTRRPSAAALLGGLTGTGVVAVAPLSGSDQAPTRPSPGTRPAGAHPRSVLPHHRRLLAALGRLLFGVDPGPPARPSRARRAVFGIAGAASAAAVAVVVATIVTQSPARPARAAGAPAGGCRSLPYQACGAPAAAHTDGLACLPGWYDLDGNAADGCEARSDYIPGTALTGSSPVAANLVPAGAVDHFTTRVEGHALSWCTDSLRLRLSSPPAAADRLEVWHGTTLVASATSVNGVPATATVTKPGCFGSHSETLDLQVREVVGAAPGDFTLTRQGGW